ncbi:hypothetical protein JL193_10585 [Polaribacter batillariae]|uniref:Lipoprotein n=1 Tax=Polaribacter batillariae TaxID=2808900 RepID=A0ABX7SSF2_9FLAO|nr:hypothetical protein [Polaribacter batillariae]QTD36589.1 hypothetical protein JL193_10585 [Polaribacter batillariae]
MAFTILLMMGVSCRNNSTTNNKNDGNDVVNKEEKTTVNQNETETKSDHKTWCFAKKTKGMNDNSNFEFIHLEHTSGDNVEGYFRSAPSGTDGSVGTLKGKWNANKQQFVLTANYVAEGEEYSEQRTYTIKDDLLDLGYEIVTGKKAVLPVVSCEQFGSLYNEYQSELMKASINTTDRSRLKKVLVQNDYTEDEMNKISFLERYVELDQDYSTAEYLLYVMDPMFCGTGGCTLYVVNEDGKVLSATSVARPPVYISVSDMQQEANKKGEWKDIYVYSEGMRRLVAKNGKYPDNASLQPEVSEKELQSVPTQYRLVMDYLD